MQHESSRNFVFSVNPMVIAHYRNVYGKTVEDIGAFCYRQSYPTESQVFVKLSRQLVPGCLLGTEVGMSDLNVLMGSAKRRRKGDNSFVLSSFVNVALSVSW